MSIGLLREALNTSMVKKKSDKILVVVESPNKIKKISSYLGDEYIIKASYGHVMDLQKGKGQGIGIDIENGYTPRYKIIPDKKDKIEAIISAAESSKLILLGTDPDREGEAIAWHISNLLESTGKPIKRIKFNEITKKVVQNSVNNQMELDQNLFDAQQARRVLDRIVGFLVSPYLMNTLGPNLSAGRVQSVATRLIIDREKEIKNFKPEEYWVITAQLAKSKKDASFAAKYHGKVDNEKDASKIKKDLEGDTFKIVKAEYKEKKRNPLPPLTTPTLQKAAANRFGMSIKNIMSAAQSLYEAGLISYIRTDSTRSSPESIEMVRNWLSINGYLIPDKPNFYAVKNNAQDAHECIRPTDMAKLPDDLVLTDEQKKVYTVVWERFAISQMAPAIYDTVSLKILSSSDHDLRASGRVLKVGGWLEISQYYMKSDSGEEGEDGMLPPVDTGDNLVLVPPGITSTQKFTQPPGRYSEASLVEELQKREIGRPSTYADIIDKIKYRGYVLLKGKAYYATDLGIKIIDLLSKHFAFLNYEYTAEMEKKLDLIASGELQYAKMMDDFFIPFSDELKKAYDSDGDETGIKCPSCGQEMKLRHGIYGYYLKCVGYSKCKTSLGCDLTDGKPVVRVKKQEFVEGIVCPKCESQMIKRDGKFGPFYSCSKYPVCRGLRKIPSGVNCDKCGKEMNITVFKGQPKIACPGYPDCKNIKDLPEGKQFDWVEPKTINPKKPKKSIRKILNAKEKR